MYTRGEFDELRRGWALKMAGDLELRRKAL